MTVGVVVDSTSDLDVHQAHELGVHLLLQTIQFAGRTWLDHSELAPEQAFISIENKGERAGK